MPRPRKPARLELRKEKGGTVWIIRDGSSYRRTGCAGTDLEGAEKKLSEYNAEKYRPSDSLDPSSVPIADALNFYASYRVPKLSKPSQEDANIAPLVPYWATLPLTALSPAHCRAYTDKRVEDGVKPSTARRELESLRAAVNFYLDERRLPFRFKLELPEKGEARLRWLTRDEAARLLHAARRRKYHHIARLILIGIYTGTRSGAIKRMRWVPSVDTGYFDLEHGVMYRRGAGERITKKRRPSIRIPSRLLPHLKRWKKLDGHCPHVIHYDGVEVADPKRAWATTRRDAGLDRGVIPHCLRHTAASWGIQNVETTQDLQVLADFLGMSLKMLLEVYGHLNPRHQSAAADAISRRPGAR
jgi:integrase